MATIKKQTTATPKPETMRASTNGKFNGSSLTKSQSQTESSHSKPQSKLSVEQQSEELVKQIRNAIHKKYGVTIQRRDSRISTKIGHAAREKLGLDVQAQINKRNGRSNGKKFDWNDWNNTVFPKLFGRPDALKYDVEVIALVMGKLYDSISDNPDVAIVDLVEFNAQSLKRRNELSKESESEDDELDDDFDEDSDDIDDVLDELEEEDDLDDDESDGDDSDEDFEIDESEEFEEEE
ncbi:MAG: hypothetical protein MUE44_10680 [Oscillatoriaceae cyanobacterium Prado104]|jgi:hypothetical protein|nr:hypothetical protein [Oscillatoriaceae cyanobacterium Prado104]